MQNFDLIVDLNSFLFKCRQHKKLNTFVLFVILCVQVFSLQCDSAVNTCAFVTETNCACGTQDGFFYLLDLRNTRSVYVIKLD